VFDCFTHSLYTVLYPTLFTVSYFLNNVHAPVYWECFSCDWPVMGLIHRNAWNGRRYVIHLPWPWNYVILNSKHPGNLGRAWLEKRGCQQITWRTEQENSAVIKLHCSPFQSVAWRLNHCHGHRRGRPAINLLKALLNLFVMRTYFDYIYCNVRNYQHFWL